MSIEKRVSQQSRVFERLFGEYSQEVGTPMARFLTGFYKQNRQMGGRDRRSASRLIYHYFRIGKAAKDEQVLVRLAMAEFLCSNESEITQLLLPQLYPYIELGTQEKVALLQAHTSFRVEDVFPFEEDLSMGIDKKAFIESLFVQPHLFIRLRPRHAKEVMRVLSENGVVYQVLGTYTLALANGTALDRIMGIAGKYEIQDLSSQQTVTFFQAKDGEHWWDACAGAGGKSLLLLDTHPKVDLLVSDLRRSILRNLDERFAAAGITSYRQKVIDLLKGTHSLLGDELFDGIILDAPCTGSGTWGRTPELISSFDRNAIKAFSIRQRQLAANVINHLKPGKPLIYITCSVFAAENEKTVAYLQNKCGLQLERMEMLQGYLHQADSMFVARLIKS